MSVLWCINIIGPDDVVAVPTYLAAVEAANRFNAWWLDYRNAVPLDEALDARMWAMPVEYPHGADSHAAALRKPSPDYAGFLQPAEDLITCVACAKPIPDEVPTYPDVSGYLCAACAPTFAELLDAANDSFVDLDSGEPLPMEKRRAIYDAHIAAGGSPADSMARGDR